MQFAGSQDHFAPAIAVDPKVNAKEHATWSPYDNNGGTCVAVAGEDYCVVAADTRMSTGFSILSRNESKIMQLSDTCAIASSGFQGDVKTLQKNLSARNVMYQHTHKTQMPCESFAQLLSNTLYFKRFFPYYTFNLLVGLDKEGKGAVYTYDAVGSYERCGYSCQGTGKALVQPVLDNQLKAASPLVLPKVSSAYQGSKEDAIDLIKDVFASAAERDIFTGDAVEIVVLTKTGTERHSMALKRD